MRTGLFFIIALLTLGLESNPVLSQGIVDSQQIEQALKPPRRTRSIAAPSVPPVVDRIKRTRGITIEDRQELAAEVEKGNVPAIDLEVLFDYNSANLTPQAVKQLQQLGRALTSDTLREAKIVVAGHTDAKGTKDYNQSLSVRRAESVRSYLVKSFSLASDQLVPVGYGQEQLKNVRDPYADVNRRVQILNLGR